MPFNKQIQTFLTGPTLQTLFATFNFLAFGIALITYSLSLFFIYLTGVALYFSWMFFFQKKRGIVSKELFKSFSKENNITLQIIQGMQDIKLLNIEQKKRWEWEGLQSEIFRLTSKRLSINQVQQAGAVFINQGKDIFLTFMVANMVIKGQLSFGALLAVQYIIGQMSFPIDQYLRFIQDAQNARISMNRLNEIHCLEEDEKANGDVNKSLPFNNSIKINNLSFAYPSEKERLVLNDIHLEIPEGKTLAIVGLSGSGKTTLLKILLKFHMEYAGEVRIGGIDLREISPGSWRRNCVAVLQDSFIFNDSIENNIVCDQNDIDYEKLVDACTMACILSLVESLPDKFKTKIGLNGMGVSQGQKQRILIARAIYRDPQYIFFDESTNALDALTETAIVNNLKYFFKNKTVIIVAHRLSTVKNADEIIVLDSGKIIEQGTHHQLSLQRGKYYDLVKNQLELGN